MAVEKGEFQIEIKVIDGDVKMKIDGLTKGFVKLETGMKKLKNASLDTGDALETMGKKNLDMMNKSGLAGATLVELGRTISDMPYGIRGVANNLSQLSTLFVTLISTSGGFKNALTVLKQTLGKGPLGIVLAFQTVISLIDYFAGSTKKAQQTTEDLTDAVSQQVIIVNELTDALDDNNITRQEGIDIASGMLKTEKRLKAILQDNLLTEEERNEKILQLAKTKKEELEIERAISELREKITKNNIDQEKTFSDIQKEKQDLNKIDLSNTISRSIQQDLLNKLGSEFNTLQDEQVQNLKDLAELYRKQGFELDEFGKKIPIKKFDEFIDKSKELKVSLDFSELNLDEGLRELDAFDMALGERMNFMGQFIVETSEQRIDRMEKESLKLLELLDEEVELVGLAEADKQKIRDYYDSLRNKNEKRFIDELVATVQQVTSMFSQATQAAYEADISIEERRTVLANNQLKERLKNESLSAKQREGINAQIAANEEALQAKRDKIAERQFENDKKVAIANALVNTYLAATDVLARHKLGLVGKIIAMTTVIGLGLAQVAAIRRQQFVPSAIGAAGGGAGGAGAGIEAPDFNIVGASASSQLAQTVAGQEAKPVKAFVVGKDISSQLELDRNISSTASFGG
jgi:hypothetical protein